MQVATSGFLLRKINVYTYMNTKISWSIIAIILVVIVGVSISRNTNTQQTSANPIKIGAVLSLTGFAAPWGEYAKQGIDLAVKNINDAGGIDGRKVEVIIEDDKTDGKQAVGAFQKLTSIDHVQGIIGGVFDFTAQPIIPLALNSKLPFISGSNFRIAGGFDLNDQSFVMLTDFNTTIRKIEPYIASSSIKKLAVVHYQSTFGGEVEKTLDSVMKDLGRGDVVDSSYAKIGDNDWKTTIIKLKNQGVDAVFLDMVGNDPLIFLKQAKQLGFTPTIMSYNGTLDAFVHESDKSLLNNVVILNWEITTPKFSNMFTKAYGIEATKSADKYFDAVYVMAQGIANSSDTSEVSAYIVKNLFVTPNGTISFTANHAVRDTNVQVEVMKDGVAVPWK